MEIWQIIVIILAFALYGWFEYYKNKTAEKYRVYLPLFTPKQMHEALDRRGPSSVSDAFEIFKAEYGYQWNNVIKAAAILGESTGADHSAAVAQLISSLDSDEPNLVAVSAVSLGKLKDPLALPHLEKLLHTQPTQSELDQQKSMLFQKSQQENYARRMGATLTGYPKIPDPQEKHKAIREAAAWAINQIRRAEATRNKDIGSKQSLEVHEAFIVLENAGSYPLEKQLQAIAALGDARGIDLPKAIRYLTAHLNHTDTNIVTLTVLILGKIGDKPVIPLLNKLLGETPDDNIFLKNIIHNSIKNINAIS